MPKRTRAVPVPAPRSRWSEADARAILAAWRQSGQSLSAYARDRGLHAQRLAWWRKRLNGWSPAALVPASALVPARVVASMSAPSGGAGVVRLPRGVVVEVADASPAWIAALVAALEGLT